MPWQRRVADVAGEIDPATGLPAYREVFVTVPRQNGKTILFLCWQIHRCVSARWSQPQKSVFTAQSGKDAREKWNDDLFPLLENSDLSPLIDKINRGVGNEGVHWVTGSIIRILSSAASSGHSKTLDQAVLDEIWVDVDDRREQALRPTMVTRPDAQLLVCSTAGTQASTVYNRKVQAGRQAASEDAGGGMAYFEWSAPEEWDPDDVDSWWEFMPALGHTITEDVIRAERQSLEDGEFRRAYGNRPQRAADRIIPPALWDAVCSDAAKPDPDSGVWFGMDVSQDRSSAAVALSDGQTVELVDHRPGTGWVAERCNELVDKWGGAVAVDHRGPAGVLADSIGSCVKMNSRDVLKACGGLFDAVVEGEVSFRRDGALDAAVEGAVKKTVGDMWAWSRKASTTDVTPLMAATLAFEVGANPDRHVDEDVGDPSFAFL